MAKQKYGGLRRGLDSLLSGASEVMSASQQAQTLDQSGQAFSQTDTQNILEVPIESILPNPRQPRRIFREDDPKLLELSASIKEHGLLQPIVVTRLDTLERLSGKTSTATHENEQESKHDAWFFDDEDTAATSEAATTVATPTLSASEVDSGYRVPGVQYQIIAGERRWRASKLAGLSRVPVLLKEVTPLQMLELALIENIQRADLNPVEEALAYQALIQEFGLTQEHVAKQVGKDRSTITNSIRLLQLAPKVRDALVNQPDNFSEGHARALIGIPREEDQVTAMSKIIALHLNVRQAEELAASMKAREDVEDALQRIRATPQRNSDIEELENHFRNALMVKVDLKKNAKGRGTLVLHFNDQEELERLYSKLVQQEE